MLDLTILICTYNGEKFLYEQLESLENQTIKPSNILIFDSGSKDKTKSIINKFIINSKIDTKLIYLKETGSPSKSFKLAIKTAYEKKYLKKYIALCDQDDIWELNKLEIFDFYLNSAYKKDNLCFFSDVKIINQYSVTLNESRYKSSIYFKPPRKINRSIFFSNPASGMSMIFSINIAKKYQSIKSDDIFMHDWTILLISYLNKSEIIICPETLVSYRQHEHNILGTQSKRNLKQNIIYMPKYINKTLLQFKIFKNKKIKYFSIQTFLDLLSSDFLKPFYKIFLTCSYFIFAIFTLIKKNITKF